VVLLVLVRAAEAAVVASGLLAVVGVAQRLQVGVRVVATARTGADVVDVGRRPIAPGPLAHGVGVELQAAQLPPAVAVPAGGRRGAVVGRRGAAARMRWAWLIGFIGMSFVPC
jgi:hypothetical protein